MEKKKSSLRWLLMIPAQGVLSVLITVAGLAGDIIFFSKKTLETGHAAPAFTLWAFIIAIGLFVVVAVVSIIITIISAIMNALKDKKAE